ncbi:redoxin domain-containing protein [bacterium]|nr:redoxin domain-containing protein [bacterium]
MRGGIASLLALAVLLLSSCNMLGGKASLEKDFSFTGADGQAHKLSDYTNKPLVLNFWAEW